MKYSSKFSNTYSFNSFLQFIIIVKFFSSNSSILLPFIFKNNFNIISFNLYKLFISICSKKFLLFISCILDIFMFKIFNELIITSICSSLIYLSKFGCLFIYSTKFSSTYSNEFLSNKNCTTHLSTYSLFPILL